MNTSHAARLGHTQVLTLRLLAEGPKSVQHLEYDHFGPSAGAFYAAVQRLGLRGLVDVAGWDGSRRTYRLTDRGREVERSLNVAPEDEA
jgi:DNA-binding PadR family transcriptional regulator